MRDLSYFFKVSDNLCTFSSLISSCQLVICATLFTGGRAAVRVWSCIDARHRCPEVLHSPGTAPHAPSTPGPLYSTGTPLNGILPAPCRLHLRPTATPIVPGYQLKGGLITTGFNARTRNCNYLGIHPYAPLLTLPYSHAL